MPKGPKKLPLYKPLTIVLKENVVREKKESELEKFKHLSHRPKRNQTELEKMRHDAGKRLREQVLRLTESDDFRIVTFGNDDCTIRIPQKVENVFYNSCIRFTKKK